jgi:biotin operon repressor
MNFFKKQEYISGDDMIVELSIAFHELRKAVEELQEDMVYVLSVVDDND